MGKVKYGPHRGAVERRAVPDKIRAENESALKIRAQNAWHRTPGRTSFSPQPRRHRTLRQPAVGGMKHPVGQDRTRLTARHRIVENPGTHLVAHGVRAEES